MADNTFFKDCNDEFYNGNELTNKENEDLFATGSLLYDNDTEQPQQDKHHFLLMLNGFNLNR